MADSASARSPPSNLPLPNTSIDTHDEESSNLPPVIVPPYWSHTRGFSSTHIPDSHLPGRIHLQDNTEEDAQLSPAERALKSPCWAKQVTIYPQDSDREGYVLVEGGVKGVGGYIVWICHVEMAGGGEMVIRKRYSEFEEFRNTLKATFPRAGTSLPQLPPKSFVYRFRANFLEKRRQGLMYFMNCVLLNPEFAGSAVLKEFIFA